MELIYLKQNLRRGEGKFILKYELEEYKAPKYLEKTDIFDMQISSRPGYAICRKIEIQANISLLNYIAKIKIEILNNSHIYEMNVLKKNIREKKILSILDKYIGEKVYAYYFNSLAHYDYDFKIYSTKEMDINELILKFKTVGKFSNKIEIELCPESSIGYAYYYLDRYKIDFLE